MRRYAMVLEVDTLQEMECFDFWEAGDRPAGNYQCTILHMVFDCKQDLRSKARLVVGGYLIDLLDNKDYFSTVKENAYVNAYTIEKVYAVAESEFGEALILKIVVIRKALY
eukprot:3580386-Ditylum_brightwellii.AAC.1